MVLGFLLGARAKVLATLGQLTNAIKKFAIKVPVAGGDADGVAGGAVGGGSGNNDNEAQMEEGFDETEDIVEHFLNTSDVRGLDDHPDLVMNPIVMYQIKIAKAEQLAQSRITALAAEGLSEDQIAERMATEDGAAGGVVGGGGGGRGNPLALLISVGARVEAVKARDNTDALARVERRRMQKNVDIFLSKSRDIETKRTEPKLRNERGGKIKNAYDVAQEVFETKTEGQAFREQHNTSIAKSSRNVLRDWHKTRKEEPVHNFDSDDEDNGQKKPAIKRGKTWGKVNLMDLARLQAEVLADEVEDEGEDGAA